MYGCWLIAAFILPGKDYCSSPLADLQALRLTSLSSMSSCGTIPSTAAWRITYALSTESYKLYATSCGLSKMECTLAFQGIPAPPGPMAMPPARALRNCHSRASNIPLKRSSKSRQSCTTQTANKITSSKCRLYYWVRNIAASSLVSRKLRETKYLHSYPNHKMVDKGVKNTFLTSVLPIPCIQGMVIGSTSPFA